MKTWLPRIACAVLLIAVVGCDGYPWWDPVRYGGDKYPTWQAPGRYDSVKGRQNVYWLDSERILYIGSDEDDPAGRRSSLRIWHVSNGEIRVLGPAHGQLCYSRGHVRYVESSEGFVETVREGPLEQPASRTGDAREFDREQRERGRVWSWLTCRYYDLAPLEPGAHCKVPLLPGDGYLQVRGDRCTDQANARFRAARELPDREQARRAERALQIEYDATPLRHVTAAGSKVLPIQSIEFSAVTYSEWNGKYAIAQYVAKDDFRHVIGEWRNDDYVVYLLSAEGDVQIVSVPLAKWFGQRPATVELARVGPVLLTPGVEKRSRRLILGVVLVRGEQLEQLNRATTYHAAMSPDGCRLAFDNRTVTNKDADPLVIRLRVVDLCARR